MSKKPQPNQPVTHKNRPISLQPLTFDEAVNKLLSANPQPAKPKAKKPKKKT